MQKIINRKLIVLIAVLLLLATVLIAAALFVKSKLDRIQYDNGETTQITNSPTEPEAEDSGEDDICVDVSGRKLVEDVSASQREAPEEVAGIFNLLLLGTDERDYEFSDSARSDCIMLISLDLDKGTGKLISLERGMGVVM